MTSLGKPIVIVPELSATSTSLLVPENVIVPPKEVPKAIETPQKVTDELDNLELAIDPASCAFVIVPDKLLVG